ncbi:MFS transporter [Paenibacillus arenilitoris]|uniref:MFS transporter n=1 Tax=Paenibacillus arenilitoris TaxID=2772299 RepID=A0A927CLH6_9BACL|nr:MFS transporter [Paenibacillus arenilitoris]MBD2868778.1 MFS transporter [Paenibacillus arenilitoris]
MHTETQSQNGDRLIRVLAVTLVITVMSATMFNIVLPEIAAEFRLTLSQASWVSSGFLLVYAIGTVIYGKLADRFKLKNVMTFGIFFFAFGSLIGLTADSYGALLAGRILQAAGAAVIPASASIIPVRYYPQEKRGRALGITMTGLAIGAAIGPGVAALAVGFLHWRWLFLMPMLTLLVLPYFRRYLKDERGKPGRMDWLGGTLLAGAVALLLLAITYDSWPSAAGCAAAFGLFALRIRSAKEPFVKPALFGSKGYALGLALAFLTTGVGYALPFLSPQLLAEVNRLDSAWIGYVMVPAAAASALLGRKGGRLADSKGSPFLFFAASALLLACFLLMSSFAGAAPAWIAGFLIFGNVGQSFMLIALNHSVSRTMSQEQVGVGMGLMAMLNFMAGAVSASVYGKLIDRGSGASWNPVQETPEAFVFSNLYLALAAVHVVILALFYVQFGRGGRRMRESGASSPAHSKATERMNRYEGNHR